MSEKDKDILVSVVMNCYNSAKYLREAIDSVYSQTYKNWELVFFDNASTDKSAQIANSYDKKLRYFKNERLVPLYTARNLALNYCKGEVVAFLDCDDYWHKTKLEKQIELYNKSKSIIFCHYFTIDDSGEILPEENKKTINVNLNRFLFKKNIISIGSILIETNILKKFRFDESLDLLGDFDLWLRLSKKHNFIGLNEYLEYSRVHDNNLSDIKRVQWQRERRKVYLKHLNMKNLAFNIYYIKYILKTEIKGLFKLR